MTAKAAASSAKHAATAKHAGTRKHTETAKQKAARHMASVKAAATRKANKAKVTAKGKPATHAKGSKPAGFAVGDLLPVCSLEAVAQSLRLAGQPVSGDEVAWLWELCGSPAAGVSVGEALVTAALFGLARYRPQRLITVTPERPLDHQPSLPFRQGLDVEDVDLYEVDHGFGERLFHDLLPFGLGGQKPCWLPVLHPPGARGLVVADAELGFGPADDALHGLYAELRAHRLGEDAHVMLADLPGGLGVLRHVPLDEFAGLGQRALGVHSLILHVDVPGPHAVLATPDGWWSWGERYDPWPCRIEEMWAVSWS